MTKDTPAKNSITIFVVMHDDVPPAKRNNAYSDYFLHLKTELESFIDRDVHIIFGSGSPHSSFEYKGENLTQILERWELLAINYLNKAREEGFITNSLTKVVLLTNDPINAKTGGVAALNSSTRTGSYAIASLSSYLVPAHEIGHLLGAKHEDFEVQYNGWWGETYMTPQRNPIRSISYHFSPANRQNIKNYLAKHA